MENNKPTEITKQSRTVHTWKQRQQWLITQQINTAKNTIGNRTTTTRNHYLCTLKFYRRQPIIKKFLRIMQID